MALSTLGVGSGLDLNNTLTQLLNLETSVKMDPLNSKEVKTQASLSAYGLMKGHMSDFQSALNSLRKLDTFQSRTTLSTNDSIVKITAGTNAQPSSYSVEVESLAATQKDVSFLVDEADVKTLKLGEGTLHFTGGGKTFNVDITDSNNTLKGIRDAINSNEKNSTVVASIINVDGGSRLVLTSLDSGSDGKVTVTATDSDGIHTDTTGLSALISANADATSTQAADAVAYIDGQKVTSSTNEITGAVDGVTFELTGQSQVGVKETVKIDLDRTATQEAVQSFVDAYNSMMTNLADLGKYDSANDVSGPLLGDVTLRNAMNAVRREIGALTPNMSSGLDSLSRIGVTTEKDGTLSLDVTKLSDAMDQDFNSIGELFAKKDGDDKGLAVRLDAVVNQAVKFNGSIYSREDSLRDTLSRVAEDKAGVAKYLAEFELRLTSQFSQLDSFIASIKQNEGLIQGQLDQFNAMNKSK